VGNDLKVIILTHILFLFSLLQVSCIWSTSKSCDYICTYLTVFPLTNTFLQDIKWGTSPI
jgi:hypothetical protein